MSEHKTSKKSSSVAKTLSESAREQQAKVTESTTKYTMKILAIAERNPECLSNIAALVGEVHKTILSMPLTQMSKNMATWLIYDANFEGCQRHFEMVVEANFRGKHVRGDTRKKAGTFLSSMLKALLSAMTTYPSSKRKGTGKGSGKSTADRKAAEFRRCKAQMAKVLNDAATALEDCLLNFIFTKDGTLAEWLAQAKVITDDFVQFKAGYKPDFLTKYIDLSKVDDPFVKLFLARTRAPTGKGDSSSSSNVIFRQIPADEEFDEKVRDVLGVSGPVLASLMTLQDDSPAFNLKSIVDSSETVVHPLTIADANRVESDHGDLSGNASDDSASGSDAGSRKKKKKKHSKSKRSRKNDASSGDDMDSNRSGSRAHKNKKKKKKGSRGKHTDSDQHTKKRHGGKTHKANRSDDDSGGHNSKFLRGESAGEDADDLMDCSDGHGDHEHAKLSGHVDDRNGSESDSESDSESGSDSDGRRSPKKNKKKNKKNKKANDMSNGKKDSNKGKNVVKHAHRVMRSPSLSPPPAPRPSQREDKHDTINDKRERGIARAERKVRKSRSQEAKSKKSSRGRSPEAPTQKHARDRSRSRSPEAPTKDHTRDRSRSRSPEAPTKDHARDRSRSRSPEAPTKDHARDRSPEAPTKDHARDRSPEAPTKDRARDRSRSRSVVASGGEDNGARDRKSDTSPVRVKKQKKKEVRRDTSSSRSPSPSPPPAPKKRRPVVDPKVDSKDDRDEDAENKRTESRERSPPKKHQNAASSADKVSSNASTVVLSEGDGDESDAATAKPSSNKSKRKRDDESLAKEGESEAVEAAGETDEGLEGDDGDTGEAPTKKAKVDPQQSGRSRSASQPEGGDSP